MSNMGRGEIEGLRLSDSRCFGTSDFSNTITGARSAHTSITRQTGQSWVGALCASHSG